MKKIISSEIFHIFLLIFLGFCLRLFLLGEIPPGVTNDELIYIYNGYSISQTLKNIDGQFLPWITKFNVPFLPIPSYLNALVFKFFELNTFWGRFSNAFLGVSQIILIYFITLKLFNLKFLSFLSAFLLTVSPWHLQLTRSAYDPAIAAFFYLFALFLFLTASGKNKHSWVFILTGFFMLFFALFSYRAMNMLALPWILLILWYIWPRLIKNKNLFLLFIGGSILLIIIYLLIIKNQGSYYLNEVNNPQNPFNYTEAQKTLDNEIANSNSSIWLSRIFLNKITYSLRLLRENYLGIFSTEFLFTKGEASGIYSIWWRGMLYLIDLPLIIAGLLFLFKKYKRQAYFILFSVIIAPTPSLFAGPTGITYVGRSFYLIFFLMILSGWGIYYFYSALLKSNKLVKKIVFLLILVIYLLHIASYLHQYYYRYPNYGADSWFKGTKDLSEFLIKHPKNNIIIANSSDFDFINYAFFAKIKPSEVQNAYQRGKKGNNFMVRKIAFVDKCLNSGKENPVDFLSKNTIYITKTSCHVLSNPVSTIKRYNGKFTEFSSVIWKIYYSKDLIK